MLTSSPGLASIRSTSIDGPRGDLHLTAAALNDCEHLYRLLAVGGKTLGYHEDRACNRTGLPDARLGPEPYG